jgi:exosortase B
MIDTTNTLPRMSGGASLAVWWPVLLGLAVLFLPLYYDLAKGPWQSEDYAHGPIVLAVSAYLIWRARHVLLDAASARPRPILGWSVLVFGLLLYALGRSQHIFLLEVGSQLPILLGLLLVTLGMRAVRALWFPLFFLLFTVPLPGFVVDATTGPLKQHISEIAEHVLYAVGYPIARSGVVLQVGPYQLLVADACSGLHSMFSLSGMGFLYLYLMQHTSRARNVLMIASILPIAFFANVLRVMILVLVTYHFGDEAGQGAFHGAAGVLLFVFGLLLLFALDALLGFVFPDRARAVDTAR